MNGSLLAEAELQKAQMLEKRDGGSGVIENSDDDLLEKRAMIG